MKRVDNLCLHFIGNFSSEREGTLTLQFVQKSMFFYLDMVGNGAGPGGDTVIDMPADQQEKKSLVWFIFDIWTL